jgi:hypothetical protein
MIFINEINDLMCFMVEGLAAMVEGLAAMVEAASQTGIIRI